MAISSVTPSEVRTALLLRQEIALLDVRHEAQFATGHPLFAANMAAGRVALEAAVRLPRKDVPIVLYDDGEGLVAVAAERLAALGYSNIRQLAGGLQGWKQAGYEVLEDVNSYAKAFGELVEHRRHTPSLAAEEVGALIAEGANIQILDVRRFDEYATMNIPGSMSVPGAELVLRAGRAAPDPETTIIVNCAGRTRSIIGTQSLINAGVTNKVRALRNGTIGWTLAKQSLDHGSSKRGEIGAIDGGEANARDVAYRAGVRHIGRGRTGRAAGADGSHAVSLRRPLGGGIHGRPSRRIPPLCRRSTGAGNRHGRACARRAHRADGRQARPRRHDRVMARADGMGGLRSPRRL